MKNDLNKDYAALCSSSQVDQTYIHLFGDLSKLAKDIADEGQLTKLVRQSQIVQSAINDSDTVVM